MLMVVVSFRVPDELCGRAVSVGAWADAVGLRAAMLAVAALSIVLVLCAPALLRASGLSTVEHARR